MKTALKLSLLLAVAACSGPAAQTTATDDDEFTSLTAAVRTVKFGGTVFVRDGASDAEILQAVKHQTQSGLGAFRTADIGINSRELNNVDPRTFVKKRVTVVDADVPSDPGKAMMRVQYTYTDKAVLPTTMRKRASISLGLLGANYESQTSRVLPDCTDNDTHAREFERSLWYVFNPSLSSCKQAMAAEQKKIDLDRAKLGGGKVPRSETNRLYVPMTASLTPAVLNTKPVYPEYDQLYAGGVQPGKLVVGMVNGLMADWAAGEQHDTIDDEGYSMWFEGLREVFKARPMQLEKTEPAEDFSTLVANGKTFTGLSFDTVMKWELDRTGFPSGTTAAEQRALRVSASQKVAKHWFTFSAKVQVRMGSDAPRPFTIELATYFGAETDPTPHKRAIKNSDVFVYNGHSYIGYGPLDPSNFGTEDFPASYQIMMINGCVSYNYYEKDYFPKKSGGSKNLDLVTNGLESWVNESGPAMGRFVASIIDGKQESYQNILKAAQFTDFGFDWGMDALRILDGELDNTYDPARTPMVVQ